MCNAANPRSRVDREEEARLSQVRSRSTAIGIEHRISQVILEMTEFVEDQRPAADNPDGLPVVQPAGRANAFRLSGMRIV